MLKTPPSVNIDMSVYSTGTPFREHVSNLRENLQSSFDFSKQEGTAFYCNQSPAQRELNKENSIDFMLW